MLLKFELLFRKFSAENGRHVGGFDMNIRLNVASLENQRRKVDTWSAIMDELNCLIDFLALETTQTSEASNENAATLLLSTTKINIAFGKWKDKLPCIYLRRFTTIHMRRNLSLVPLLIHYMFSGKTRLKAIIRFDPEPLSDFQS